MPPKHSESREKELETATIEYEVPDGGYGWVVVVCAFIFISLPMGISASFGLYYEEWLEYFEAGKVHTSLVGSIGSGSVPLLGSLGGMILTNLLGDIRLVGITGCFLSSTGFILSYFATDIKVLAFTYGALGGFGMGLMFNCAYLSVGFYFDKNRPLATALASSGTGFGTLISLLIRQLIPLYGWRGSLLIMAAICIQCIVFGVLIRPLYAKKIPSKPCMSAVEEVIPKITITGDSETEPLTTSTPPPPAKTFASHDGIFRPRKASMATKMVFASQLKMHLPRTSHHDTALLHHKGDVKINPYIREDVFFQGSTHDIQKIGYKPERNENDSMASQLTIPDVPLNLTGWAKIKQNLRKNFNLRILKNPTFFMVVLAMTLHHMAFFIPYTYVISLTKEHGIPTTQSEYLIICFGLSNFIWKLVIGRVMTLFEVEQLYVVITTLTLGSIAAILATFCTKFYQFVLVAVMYGGTSPIVTIYLTNILVRYLGIANLTNAFSIVTIIRGLGSLSGPPLAGFVIETTGLTKSAFYVGSTCDILAAITFGMILFINRNRESDNNHQTAPTKKDSLKMDSLDSPKVIVTVPTAEGNLDKMIHYSNERFNDLAVKDQVEHARRMRQRIKEQHLKPDD